MIQLLGIGVPGPDGRWLLRRVCASLDAAELTIIVSRRPAERLALLDAVTARLIPEEGRVWVNRLPVMRGTARRIRSLVGEADLNGRLFEARSLLWNVLAPSRPGPWVLRRLLRLPCPSEREAALRALARVGLESRAHSLVSDLDLEARVRLAVARGLVRRPEHLVIREPDVALGLSDAGILLRCLHTLASSERLSVVVSVAEVALARTHADRILGLADGHLAFDGAPAELTDDAAGWRFRLPLGVGG